MKKGVSLGNQLYLETAGYSAGFSYYSKLSNRWDEVVYDLEKDDEENEKVYEGRSTTEINNNKVDASGLNKGVYFVLYLNNKTNERSYGNL
jgi:hypothetical protein